jgi:hypothetical protein
VSGTFRNTEKLLTRIGYQEVLSSMITENRVSLENLNRLGPKVGNLHVNNVVVSTGNGHSERASRRGSANKESNGDSLSNHRDKLCRGLALQVRSWQ